MVNQEGMIVARGPLHRGAVLPATIDTEAKLYDASAYWRERCMRGVLHSGKTVKDQRSRDRRTL